MSRTKDLKQATENNVNIFELFSLFSPEKKSKYTETLLRIMKKTPNIDEHVRDIKMKLGEEFGIMESDLNGTPKIQLIFFYRIIDSMFNFSDLKSYQKFCELNERNLIRQNDLSTYNSFDDILNAINIAELIVDAKELEKQIIMLFENEEWLVIRPLTYQSSKKYGSNTKWCTTQESNPEYFLKYSSKGILIYCLNKKTGYKVACFYSLDKNDPEFSWWNQKDTRIDSLQAEISNELRELIFKGCTSKDAKTNRFYLSDEERRKEERLLGRKSYDSDVVMEQPQAVEEERVDYMRRAIERAQDEPTEMVTAEEPMTERILQRLWDETEEMSSGSNELSQGEVSEN
jgi:hypothetical protein